MSTAILFSLVACSSRTPPSRSQSAASGASSSSDAFVAALDDAGRPSTAFGAAPSSENAQHVEIVSLPLPQSPRAGALCSMDRTGQLEQLEKTILLADASALSSASSPSSSRPRVTSAPWDHVTPPARLDRLTERFALTGAELEALKKNGFVVPARLAFDSYTVAFHELYQSELPLYVSIDAILHTVFVSHDELVERVELAKVIPALEHALRAMHQKLIASTSTSTSTSISTSSSSPSSGTPRYPSEVKEDLDVYLTVARTLLDGRAPTTTATAATTTSTTTTTSAQAAALVEQVKRANQLAEVSIFGRARMIDFSQYAPRGHYAKSDRLARFFRAAMWLSRLELNLVSRSSRSSQPGFVPNPEETPREAVDALALADLADDSGSLTDIAKIDRGWAALAGAREDVPLEKLRDVAKRERAANGGRLTIPASFEALKKEIGGDFKRTTRLHYMPQGSTDLPAIATMLGPRIVPDSAATRPLVHGDLPDRYDLGAADIAYMLGHDRAKKYLEKDILKFPALPAALEKSRGIAMKPPSGTTAIAGLAPSSSTDVYGAWLDTVKALSRRDEGTVPSYMTTDAFRDLRINETIAGYAQIKHNYVLIAGQPYDEGACDVPDAFVDPAIGAWDALVAYAGRAEAAFRELDARDTVGAQAYFIRLATIAKVLRAIAKEEVAGRALSPEALAFLSSVVEIHSDDIGTGFSTRYDGWYFDLFLSRPEQTTEARPGRANEPAMKYAGFIADFYTSVNTGLVAYAGATAPRLGIFVVDTSGPPRVVIGPVAHAFEHHAPLDARRLKDADVRKLEATAATTATTATTTTTSAPWAASYEVAGPADPPLVIETEAKVADDTTKGHTAPIDVILRSTRALGDVKVVLMDHNRHPVATMKKEVNVASKTVRFSFPARVQRMRYGIHGTEMIEVSVGDWSTFVDLFGTSGAAAFGGMKLPSR